MTDSKATTADPVRTVPNVSPGWFPVESAPLNTAVLVFVPNWEHYGPGIYRAIRVNFRPANTEDRWFSSAWSCGRDFGAECQPTHWMPLPSAPDETAVRP